MPENFSTWVTPVGARALAILGHSWQFLAKSWKLLGSKKGHSRGLKEVYAAGYGRLPFASGLGTVATGTASKAKCNMSNSQVTFSKFAILIPRCVLE